MIKARKRLSFWSALPPYLGGKRRLCPVIFREIDRLIPRRDWAGLTFLDGFLGGGSVALYAKAQGFRVKAVDIAARSLVVGQALVANARIRLSHEDVLQTLVARPGAPGPVEMRYVPRVFPRTVARAIDAALARANACADPAKAALLRLLAIRLAMLCHPMSQVRSGTIHRAAAGEWESITPSCRYHYAEALRLATPGRLWRLALEINAGVFMGAGEVVQGDLLELLPGLAADVAYFDPPYPDTASYEKEYRVLDEILEGRSRPPSPFTAGDGARQLDLLLARATHIPLWVLSFGNATCAVEDLEAKMARHGRRVRALALPYAHKASVATAERRAADREYIVMGWDPRSRFGERSVHAVRAGEDVSQLEVGQVAREIEAHPNGGRTQGPAAQSLAGDGLDESQSPGAEEELPGGRMPVSCEAQDGVDPPDTVVEEVTLDADAEVAPSRSGCRFHDDTVPLLAGEVKAQHRPEGHGRG